MLDMCGTTTSIVFGSDRPVVKKADTKSTGRGGRSDKFVVMGKNTTATGREIWTVSSSGRSNRLTTSTESAAKLDQAVERYRNALKRLADR
jgi:sugar (pentulose or hexulose) kinase